MLVTVSVLLYGTVIWTDVLKLQKYKRCMYAVQQSGALRVVCSYRIVLDSVVFVVMGIIPIDLLIQGKGD